MNLFLKIGNGKWKFERRTDGRGGVQYIFEFENGYSASVIKNQFSYGFTKDLWELAVIKDGELNYENPVTEQGVKGYLTDTDVNKLLKQIKRFKKEG